MTRTTITLTEELAETLDREARRERKSRSKLIRELLKESLEARLGARRTLPWAGMISEPELAPAAELDELMEGWADAIDRDRG